MAAGLDTRAYRLAWPEGTTVFEVDQPSILAHKEQVLLAAGAQATCVRKICGANFTMPWVTTFLATGFDPQRPSLWLLEGFLFYLASETIT